MCEKKKFPLRQSFNLTATSSSLINLQKTKYLHQNLYAVDTTVSMTLPHVSEHSTQQNSV